MLASALFALASALAFTGSQAQTVTGAQGDAIQVLNNPVGPVYTAVLPADKGVKGSISATAAPGGAGVKFTVNFSNLPASGGPFPYHIHVLPVAANGSCTSTLAHLDPFIRGEQPPCDASKPATCQVGDLSGKYGKITSDPFSASYVDPYVSLVPGLGSFFGNRSFVVHFANTTRISCASFSLVGSNGTATTTAKPPVITSAAAVGFSASIFSIAIGIAALVL